MVVGDDHHGGRGGTWLPFRTRRAGVASARHGAWLGLVLDGPGTPVKVVEYAPEGLPGERTAAEPRNAVVTLLPG